MLTRCPACSTAFRVQPEQLKARQGKVRCGECQQVFNALDSLIEEFVVKPATSAEEPSAAADDMAMPNESGFSSAETASSDAVPPALSFIAETESAELPAADAEPAPIQSAETVEDMPPEPLDMAAVAPAVEPVVEPAVESAADSTVETLGLEDTHAAKMRTLASEVGPMNSLSADDTTLFSAESLPAVGTPLPPELAGVALTRQRELAAPAPSFGTHVDFEPALHLPEPSGSRLWLWLSASVLAALLLAAQLLLHYRVELATAFPDSRSALVKVCGWLGCRVDLPRKIDLLSIESSDLHPDSAYPGEAGRLGVQLSLRNRAPFAQTWPHLELTLTDSADKPIVRRVIEAREYLLAQAPSEAQLAEGIAARSDVSIELALDVGELVASGYRLYLFYP